MSFRAIFKSVLLTGLCAILFKFASADQTQSPQVGEIRVEKRAYTSWFGKTGEYEVGTFYVRENRSEPDSRVIGIGYSRFVAKEAKGPPIFFLPGGPGGSFQETGDGPRLRKTPFHAEFLWDSCDVICVDQRGFSSRGDILTGVYQGATPKPDDGLDERVAEYQQFAKSITEK